MDGAGAPRQATAQRSNWLRRKRKNCLAGSLRECKLRREVKPKEANNGNRMLVLM